MIQKSRTSADPDAIGVEHVGASVDDLGARQHGTGGRQVVPGTTEVKPAGGHLSGSVQVVPGATVVDPADGHRTGTREVVPRAAVGDPAGCHDLRGRIEVVPGAAITHPSAHEGAGLVRVNPLAVGALEEAGRHVARRAEQIVRAVDRVPAILEVALTVGAGVEPAGRVLRPVAALGARARVDGTGVVAGGAMRAVLESVGVTDVLAKSKGSSNPHNLVKATILALSEMRDARMVAQNRGVSMEKVFRG